jgi:hypothetical protein
MKKVLFISQQNAKRRFDYNSDFNTESFHLGWNSGNMLFTNAIQTYLEFNNQSYDITSDPTKLIEKETFETYQCCILNCANWLMPINEKLLATHAQIIKKSKIPVFLVGLGTQTSGNLSFKNFNKDFLNTAKNFIRSVIKTGGTFGLRGYYTAEFFDFLGFPKDYTVTGCPSIFQSGKNLQVSTEKVSNKDFSPIFNGGKILDISNIEDYFNTYKRSVFIDQDSYLRILKFPNSLNNQTLKVVLIHHPLIHKLLLEDRVKLFTNTRNWLNFIDINNYNFSFGSRFHGSVGPILCGIPSLLLNQDSRTKELTDYFNIPSVNLKSVKNNFQLYEEYLKTDYSDFNAKFPNAFENFKSFIETNNIPFKLPFERPVPIAPEYEDHNVINPNLNAIIAEYIKFKPLFKLPFLNKRRLFILKKANRLYE